MMISSPCISRSYSLPPWPLSHPSSSWYQRLLASTSRTTMGGCGRMPPSRPPRAEAVKRPLATEHREPPLRQGLDPARALNGSSARGVVSVAAQRALECLHVREHGGRELRIVRDV